MAYGTSGAKNLTYLWLQDTKLAGAGLRHLAALPKLATLRMYGTGLTDDGLRELVPLKSLTFLDIRATKATGAGLRHLASFTRLTELALVGQ